MSELAAAAILVQLRDVFGVRISSRRGDEIEDTAFRLVAVNKRGEQWTAHADDFYAAAVLLAEGMGLNLEDG